jgi:hypothetical protein
VFEHKPRGAIDAARVRRVLVAVLIGTGLLAGVSMSAAAVVGFRLAGEQEELTRRIAERRMALRAGRDGPAQIATPLRLLERRKHQSPSSVIVLEVLSQILPRPHLRHRAAHRGRQVARDRRDARRARADPADRAVAAFHPRHVLRPDHARARPIRASVSTSRRRSNRSARCAHEHRRHQGASPWSAPCWRRSPIW